MANYNKIKGRIAILTGGGDVPGLNPAIRGVTTKAIREGYEVIGGLFTTDDDEHTFLPAAENMSLNKDTNTVHVPIKAIRPVLRMHRNKANAGQALADQRQSIERHDQSPRGPHSCRRPRPWLRQGVGFGENLA